MVTEECTKFSVRESLNLLCLVILIIHDPLNFL